MSVMELLFLINRGVMLGFKVYDRVQAGELTPEEALEQWKNQVVKLKAEEARFDKLTQD